MAQTSQTWGFVACQTQTSADKQPNIGGIQSRKERHSFSDFIERNWANLNGGSVKIVRRPYNRKKPAAKKPSRKKPNKKPSKKKPSKKKPAAKKSSKKKTSHSADWKAGYAQGVKDGIKNEKKRVQSKNRRTLHSRPGGKR